VWETESAVYFYKLQKSKPSYSGVTAKTEDLRILIKCTISWIGQASTTGVVLEVENELPKVDHDWQLVSGVTTDSETLSDMLTALDGETILEAGRDSSRKDMYNPNNEAVESKPYLRTRLLVDARGEKAIGRGREPTQ